MPVSLSIKNVPDDVAERLRERTKRNHRSLQGELLAILEEGVEEREQFTPSEVLRRVRASGLRTPDEATEIIRGDRDTDHGRVQRDTAIRDQKEVQETAPTITVKELSEWVKARGFTTKSDSVQILREERQQVGKCGELLVQYQLLKNEIESAPMSTDYGIDLVAIDPDPKTHQMVTIQVKACTHHEDTTSMWVEWNMPKDCVADYVAAVDLQRDKGWLFTREQFEKFAASGRWLWWYIPSHRPKRAKSRPEEDFDQHTIDVVVPKLFP